VNTLAYTPCKKQLRTINDFEEPETLSRAIIGLDDGLETAGNTLAGLMSTYETSVQDLDMGLRALEYKADAMRDTLGSPSLGISRDLATPTAWGAIASLSTKLEEIESKDIVTPQKLSDEILTSETRLRSQLEGRVKALAATKSASVDAQMDAFKVTLLQSLKVIHARLGQEHGRISRLESFLGTLPVPTPQANNPPQTNSAALEEKVKRLEA
jgi:hypothetical protein